LIALPSALSVELHAPSALSDFCGTLLKSNEQQMVHGSGGLVIVFHEQMLSNARDAEVNGPFLFDSELDRVAICAFC
jgi:hypothetical protein